MVCRTRLSQVMSSTLLTPAQAAGSATVPAAFPFNGQDQFGNVVRAYPAAQAIAGLPPGATIAYNLVDVCGNILVQGVPYDTLTTAGAVAAPTPLTQVCYRNLVRYS